MSIEKRLDYTNPSGSLEKPSVSLDTEFDTDGLTEAQLAALEARQLIDEQVSAGKQWTATGASLVAELGGGLYFSHKLHRSAKFAQGANYLRTAVKTLRAAKTASVAGIVAPEPASTGVGIATYALAEAGLWALSNAAGQQIRISMGVQEEYSAGEAVASAVFGASITGKIADNVLGLGTKSLADQKLWKTRELVKQGSKLAVSGGVLGIAETAMRQELQLILNERENRDVYEYLLAAGIGGGLNTGFGLIASTGKWGRNLAQKTAKNSRENINNQIKALKEEMEIVRAKGGGSARGRVKNINSNIRRLEDALLIVDDIDEMIQSSGKTIEFMESPYGQQLVQAENSKIVIPDEPSIPTQSAKKADESIVEIPKQSKLEGVPDAANAQKTQVATTTPTYVKAADILNKSKTGNILDYGAGRGKGSEAIGADSFEPFPREGFNPTYKDSGSIPSESYDKVISASVINVVPKDVRDGIVKDIGRVLKPEGEAIITARTVSDVSAAKNKTTFEGEENAFVIGDIATGTFQKGFTQSELETYVKAQLGDNFEVVAAPKTEDGQKINGAAVLVRKIRSDAEAPTTPSPRSKEELEIEGNKFLEQQGLGLDDFVIDPITNQPSPVPLSGASGARKPTLAEIGAYRLLTHNRYEKGGSLKQGVTFPMSRPKSFGEVIDLLTDPKSNMIDGMDERTEELLDILKLMRKQFPEMMNEVKIFTYGTQRAHYSSSSKQIGGASGIRVAKGEPLDTIVHEAVHAVTHKYIYQHVKSYTINKKGTKALAISGKNYLKLLEDTVANESKPLLIRELSEVYLETIKRMGVRKQIEAKLNANHGGDRVMYNGYNYGLGNLHEFLAEALTSPQFQRELNSIQLSRKGRSAWSQFTSIIKRLLGFDVTKGSVLDEVLSLTSAIARDNEQLYKEARNAKERQLAKLFGKDMPSLFIGKFKTGVLSELDPNSKEAVALSNLPAFEEGFLPKGEITKEFEESKRLQATFEGEIDGIAYEVQASTLEEAMSIAAMQHVTKSMQARRDEVISFDSIKRAANDNELTIDITPLNTLKREAGSDSNVEITLRNQKGDIVNYNDLDKKMQYEVNLALKANGGVYINPADVADIGTPKAFVDPKDKLNFLNELDAEPPVVAAVDDAGTTPPPTPPLTEEGAAGSGGDPRFEQLRLLRKKLAKYTNIEGEDLPDKEELLSRFIQVEFPEMAREAKRLDRDSKELMDNALAVLSLQGPNPTVLRELYDEVVFMRKANVVRDTLETTVGRSLQAMNKKADIYAYEGQYSVRARMEDDALNELEEVLKSMITGKNTGEEDSLEDLLTDFLDDFFDVDQDFVVDTVNVRDELKNLDAEELDAEDLKITQETEEVVPIEDTGAKDGTGKTKETKKNNSLSLEEKLAKRQNKIEDQIQKLEERLEKARKEFVASTPVKDQNNTDLGLEDELIDAGAQPKPEKTPKDPRIERLQTLLKFYKDSRNELKTLIERKRERARLAAIEGSSDITLQKKELEKLKKDRKPTSLDQINKEIRDIRNRMRRRLREIEAAELKLEGESAVDASARIQQKLIKKRERLQKQLDGYRARFTDRGPTEDVTKIKQQKIEDEQTKQLEKQIQFYRNAEKEVAQTKELSEKLAKLAEIEGRGVMSELEATVGTKPKPPKSEDPKIKELRKQINESKARMRKKLQDIEKARMDNEQLQLLFALEKGFMSQLGTDNASRFTRFFRSVRSARTMSLIAQLPSVLAGVPTGIVGGIKQVFRIPASFFSSLKEAHGSLPSRIKTSKLIAQSEGRALFAMLPKNKKEAEEYWESFKRSYLMNQSVTDGVNNKYETEGAKYGTPKGMHALVVRARTNAQIRINARDSFVTKLGEMVRLGKFGHLFSFGVRGIVGVDDVFKRSLFKARITADSYRRALLEFPEGDAKTEKRAKELYETAWVEQDGLPVLAANNEFAFEIDSVRKDLLFASNADDVEDLVTSVVDDQIKMFNKTKSSDNIFGVVFDGLMPFFGVATRGVYRAGRLQFFPAMALRAALFNPYTDKIKRVEGIIENLRENATNAKVNKESRDDALNAIKSNLELVESLKINRLKYNEEILTEVLMGTSVAATAMLAGAAGNMTGSLSFLSSDQQKRAREYGIQPYRALGMDYRAALPFTFALSMYGDIGAFLHLRNVQAETNQPILDPELHLFEVMRRSALSAASELPLFSGINSFQELTDNRSGTAEQAASALEKILTSYIPVPAQVRKIVKKVTVDNKIVDLKGGSFYDRVAYQVLGVAPMNYKTNHFGENLETDINWITETVWRQAPRFKRDKGVNFEGSNVTTFEDIIGADSQGIIRIKPTYLSQGVKMEDFRNEEGVTLKYYYAQQLRTYKQRYKGRNRTLSEAVNELINDRDWQKKYESGYELDPNNPQKYTQKGLEEIDELLTSYYTNLRKNIAKDKDVAFSFINKEDVTLGDFMQSTLDNLNSNIRNKPFSLKDFYEL
jgi:hypothetical protein